MFWKKKTVYETRQVYSIRQELERLRPMLSDLRDTFRRAPEHIRRRTFKPQRSGLGIRCLFPSESYIW